MTRARSLPTGTLAPGRADVPARTLRTDRWWQTPLTTVVLLSSWVIYAVVRTASQRAFFVERYHYLSPFSSPCVTTSCPQPARDLGTWFGHFPPFVPLAVLVLPFLLGFRLTCYYYRKAYYRSFWQSPPACAVAEPHAKYTGETRFPLIIQNVHRYFFLAAVLISVLNTWDLIRAFTGKDGGFGIGLGTLIMLVNVVMLWTYTLSCHSCRHITGGRLRNFSAHPLRYRAWTFVSKLNTRHMELAWITLGTLMLTDGYIALVASGTFGDPRLVN
ncbi:MAG: rane protein [Pseudonocardiales bacterium]|nr:rane protein [Pseudonocardiales bacterium]